MKKFLLIVLAVFTVFLTFACTKKNTVKKEDIIDKTFVREKGGFAGDFTISFYKDGLFRYYEGPLSSYIGMGKWSIEKDNVILDEAGNEKKYVFSFKDNKLIFNAEGSDNFLYLKCEDGDLFKLTEEKPWYQE